MNVQASQMEPGGRAPVAMVSDMCPYRWEPDFFKLNQTWGHYQPFSKQCLLVAASYNLVVPNPPPPTVFPTMLTFQNLTNLFLFFPAMEKSMV